MVAIVLGLLVAVSAHVLSTLAVHRHRLYRLQAVSVGMSRRAVTARLGEPHYVYSDNDFVEGEGEILCYASTGVCPDDMWVIMDKSGRVASVLYPDIGDLGKGELSVGPSSEAGTR